MDRNSVLKFIILLIIFVQVISIPRLDDESEPEKERGYEVGDYIPLFANTVRSPGVSCEAKSYFDLPFCPPGSPINRVETFKEVFEGDCVTNTQYVLRFRVNKINETLCEKQLTKDDIAAFKYAIKNNFVYQMCYDKFRLQASVGYTLPVDERAVKSGLKSYLYSHVTFVIDYNGNQVKSIDIWEDYYSKVDITKGDGIKVNFTYSVFWREVEVNSFDPVLNKTSMNNYESVAEQKGYWMSLIFGIIYSCIGLLVDGMIHWVKKNYWYSQQLHSERCRCPPFSSLLGAFLGVGIQLLIMICYLFYLVFNDFWDPCIPFALASHLLWDYCLSSAICCYLATVLHGQYAATGLEDCIFLTGVLFFVPAFITVLLDYKLGEVAYGVLIKPKIGRAAGTLLWRYAKMIFSLWGPATIALLCVGSRIGRGNSQVNCATRTNKREIPQRSWYMNILVQMFLSGIVPFMAVFSRMDKIYGILWNWEVCGVFETLFVAFTLVIAMTLIVAMSFTSLQLARQDHQWWWRSVLRGGSTGVFMFFYGFHFYRQIDEQEDIGLLVFMGYNACIFYAVFMILGSIGFYSSYFVFRYYQRVVKID